MTQQVCPGSKSAGHEGVAGTHGALQKSLVLRLPDDSSVQLWRVLESRRICNTVIEVDCIATGGCVSAIGIHSECVPHTFHNLTQLHMLDRCGSGGSEDLSLPELLVVLYVAVGIRKRIAFGIHDDEVARLVFGVDVNSRSLGIDPCDQVDLLVLRVLIVEQDQNRRGKEEGDNDGRR